jgi:hypothetical protein
MKQARILIGTENDGDRDYYQVTVDGELCMSSVYGRRESDCFMGLLAEGIARVLCEEGVLLGNYQVVNDGEILDDSGNPVSVHQRDPEFSKRLEDQIKLKLGRLALAN